MGHSDAWGCPMSIFDLARELAAPVARGMLPKCLADAALLCSALKAERDGTPGHAFENYGAARHVLGLHTASLETKQDLAIARIRRVITPMIASREKSSRLLAEAHNINGEAGFPLTEAQVNETVTAMVFWHRRGAHGS